MTELKSGTLLFVSLAPGDALRAARRLVERTAIVTTGPLSWQLQHVDDQLAINPYDIEALCDAVTDYARRHRLAGVVTFDERSVVATARLQQSLKLPGNAVQAAYASRNKFMMRMRFREAGLETPGFCLVKNLDEAVRAATSQMNFPLVLKPVFGMASEGVLRVNNMAELEAAFPVVKGIARNYRAYTDGDEFNECLLLETYLDGREIAVDAFLAGGKFLPVGIFDKADPLEGPTFVETIYVSPSTLDKAMSDRVIAEVRRGAEALGLTIGPLHAELRLTARGPVLLEIGARAIGGVCGRAHTYGLGFDYQEVALRAVLGQDIDISTGVCTPSGVMMIPAPGKGILRNVSGIEDARRVQGVRDLAIMSKPGDILVGLPEQGCYVGFIFATGTSQQEVVRSLNESHSKLNFEISPIC